MFIAKEKLVLNCSDRMIHKSIAQGCPSSDSVYFKMTNVKGPLLLRRLPPAMTLFRRKGRASKVDTENAA